VAGSLNCSHSLRPRPFAGHDLSPTKIIRFGHNHSFRPRPFAGHDFYFCTSLAV